MNTDIFVAVVPKDFFLVIFAISKPHSRDDIIEKAEGSYAAMIPRLKTWDSNKDEKVSRALLLSETLRERVTLEYDARVPATASLSLTPVAVRAG